MSLELPAPLQAVLLFFHPILMWLLFGMTIYALYLGIKAKRTRQAKGEAKKELIKGKYKLKHYQVSSLLLAYMVLGSIGGMAVTYINNGKLFVEPHLLVGLGMTGLIAISASMAPFLQRGVQWVRVTHVGLNMILVLLFGWEAVTGMEIVQKIASKM